jgi:hypothetical protein
MTIRVVLQVVRFKRVVSGLWRGLIQGVWNERRLKKLRRGEYNVFAIR